MEMRRNPEEQLPEDQTPLILVVANKTDLNEEEKVIRKEVAETVVTIDWENYFIEASARDNINIDKIFHVIIQQMKIPSFEFKTEQFIQQRRRQSLPLFNQQKHDKIKRHSCSLS